jgi:hypothetical protein
MLPDPSQNVAVFREAVCVLLCHQIVSNPDGKFPPMAFDQVSYSPRLLSNEYGHTGRTRIVVSDLAVTNAHGFHSDLKSVRALSRQPNTNLTATCRILPSLA